MSYLSEEELGRALTLADLTDPAYGPHCMQQLVAGATDALRGRWGCPVLVHRAGRVVSVADNYDAPLSARRPARRATRATSTPGAAAQPDVGSRPIGTRTLAPTAPGTCRCTPGSSGGATRSTACTSASPISSTCGRVTERR